jgi:hypothetical protein
MPAAHGRRARAPGCPGKSRGTSADRLLDEVTTLLLAEFDVETRFRLRLNSVPASK